MKRALSLLMAASLALGLAACGNNASTNDDANAAGDNNGASGSDKVWVIASDTVFKPFEYTDAEGNFVGIDVDLVKAIAEDQGFQYEINPLGWDAAVAACQSGQADGMISGASITDERIESGWMFSDGYYQTTQTMTVAADSDITGFADLAGKTVAVKTGTQSAAFANSIAEEYGFTVVTYDDSPAVYAAVTGGIDAAGFEDYAVISYQIENQDLDLKMVGDQQQITPYGFAVLKGNNPELIEMFNEGLANITESGKLAEIFATYGIEI